MKAIALIVLSLLPFNALALSEHQKHAIRIGFHAPYSQETIDRVTNEFILTLSQPDITFDFEFSQRADPASKYHWAAFWLFQALDVYTTDKAMQWDCVKELNPLLPERPTAGRIVIHKYVFLWPLVQMDSFIPLTDEELWPATAITAGVVLSNFNVIKNAKRNCKKI